MIWIIGIQAVVLLIVVIFYQRELSHWKEIVWNMGVREIEERAKLLDRIQHPERVQVEPGDWETPDPPKDAAELAAVGTIVPEFVQVGGED
jgi:hypothetical protein